MGPPPPVTVSIREGTSTPKTSFYTFDDAEDFKDYLRRSYTPALYTPAEPGRAVTRFTDLVHGALYSSSVENLPPRANTTGAAGDPKPTFMAGMVGPAAEARVAARRTDLGVQRLRRNGTGPPTTAVHAAALRRCTSAAGRVVVVRRWLG